MRIESDTKLDFKDVLIRPKRSTLNSRAEVQIARRFIFPHSKQVWDSVPVIAANMVGTGTLEMANRFTSIDCGFSVALHKHYFPHQLEEWFSDSEKSSQTWYSLGIRDEDFRKLAAVRRAILKKHPDSLFPRLLCLDIANGHTQAFVDGLKKLREKYPDAIILAGAVATPEMAEELIISGADIVKAGIGSGSVCTTRIKTGVGFPQLSCVIECADAVHGLGGHLCSDGGCTSAGDICKAFGAGADFVMLGGMLAATDCAEMEVVEKDGSKHVQFYGMSSEAAQEKFGEGLKTYRTSEGRHVLLPYRGPVDEIIQDICGGLRSCCAYTGSRTLKELPKRATFLRVTQQFNPVYTQMEHLA